MYERGNEENQCDEDAVQLDLNREENGVIIKDAFLTSSEVYPGGNIEATVSLLNIGSEDENAMIEISVEELGISSKSETFVLESFGDKDSATKILLAAVPSDAPAKIYEVKIRSVSNGNTDEKTMNVTILKRQSFSSAISGGTIRLGNKSESKVNNANYYFRWFLGLGIVLLAFLIWNRVKTLRGMNQ